MQQLNINYSNKQATLTSISYAFIKQQIDPINWNVLPMFAFQDSMSVKGIVIYHGYDGRELIHFENLKAHDYVSNTGIGSVGYKIYNSSNIETADSLLLTAKLSPTFANKLDYA